MYGYKPQGQFVITESLRIESVCLENFHILKCWEMIVKNSSIFIIYAPSIFHLSSVQMLQNAYFLPSVPDKHYASSKHWTCLVALPDAALSR